MPDPRRITDVAIDCAIHMLPEPSNGWRNLIPPKDLGAMVSSGSGQITLQALVAQFHYDGKPANETLVNYYNMCKHRFMLSEPWSVIYGEAIVNCWAAVVTIARRKNLQDFVGMYMELLDMWASTCALMESDRKVMHAGCRSWGFNPSSNGITSMWLMATRRKKIPRPGSSAYGVAGKDDNWGWLVRNAWMSSSVFYTAASKWYGKDHNWLLLNMPKWNARTEMCLYGWADGSRLWTMGDEEVELDDEDSNSNTPGILAAGVLGGQVVSLPPWPAKDAHGNEIKHLRQTAVFADIDGNPRHGWILYHSALGGKPIGSYLVSEIPPYKPDELIFAVRIPSDFGVVKNWTSLRVNNVPVVPSEPADVPMPSTTKSHRSFFDILKKLWPF